MPHRPATDDQSLPPRDVNVPAYRWLYEAFRAEILEGRLRPGTRLASTRHLARQHRLSRGTVVTAFEQLQSEGYITGREGSGTFVATVVPARQLRARGSTDSQARVNRPPPRHFSSFATRVKPFLRFGTRAPRAFRTHLPALDLFPISLWAQVATRRVRRASTKQLVGCGPMGYGPLREVIADYLGRSRGVRCAPEQVAIVSGVQEALSVVTQLFVNPGDRVCMEDPGYTGAARMFEAIGASIVALPVDQEGMEVPGFRAEHARLAYVTPAHQFPLGISMSLARRLRLLEWARTSGALIVEDDYDSEYRFAERPLPALQGLDRHGVVLFTGSFSKVLFPSIRLGYLVVPPDIVEPMTAMLTVVSQHAPLLDQAVLCDFISEGHFSRHVRRMRQVYGERLSTLLSCASKRLTGLLELSPIEAGLQTTGRLRAGLLCESAARAAATRDVDVVPLSRYARGQLPYEGLLLGFAAVGAEEIERGVQQLAVALEGEWKSRR